MILPRGDDPRLAPALLEACRTRRIEILIPTVDVEFAAIAQARDSFEAMGIAVALSPDACLRLCRDKQALLARLEGVVPVPASVPLTAATAASADGFPLFVKPRAGAGSRNAQKIARRAELDGLPHDGSYLLQEYLPGAEYSVDVYIGRAGQPLAAVPRERIKTDSGVAVTARTVRLPELMDAALRTAQAIGIRHVANVQFRRARDGQFKLLEVNARFPGTLPLTARAGVDIPRLLIDDLSGKPLPASLLPFDEVMVVRYWTEHFFDPSEWKELCPR
jgi:carbamoyl-phosphate synthase large subunit